MTEEYEDARWCVFVLLKQQNEVERVVFYASHLPTPPARNCSAFEQEYRLLCGWSQHFPVVLS